MMEAGRGSAGGFQGASSATRHHVQQQELPQQQRGSRADITAGDLRDQEQQELLQLSMELPITYMPFKFENRRVRIDWRLLHGVDIDKLVGWCLQLLVCDVLGVWCTRSSRPACLLLIRVSCLNPQLQASSAVAAGDGVLVHVCAYPSQRPQTCVHCPSCWSKPQPAHTSLMHHALHTCCRSVTRTWTHLSSWSPACAGETLRPRTRGT